MHEIHRAILDGGYPNCSSLAARLEVTPKTVQRDITFMRDEFRLPLVYDERHHGYRYEGDEVDFPDFEVGAEELAALFLARNAMESTRGTSFGEKMREVFVRLTRTIGERVNLSWAELDEAFSRKGPEMKSREVKMFGQLADAVVRRRVVGFHYRKLRAGKAEARTVHPLHLGEVEGSWYLIAHDCLRNGLRTFALPRITRVRVSGESFERPAGFDGRAHLRQRFGIWGSPDGAKPFLVRVELRDYAARLAQERRWHPTQEVRLLDDSGDRVELRFEAAALEEVLRWVLSFGSRARVIGPAKLKRELARELRAMTEALGG